MSSGYNIRKTRLLRELIAMIKSKNNPYDLKVVDDYDCKKMTATNVGNANFDITLPDNWPFAAPRLTCTNGMQHTLFHPEREVCQKYLESLWTPTMTLNELLHKIAAEITAQTQA